ncbi:MAG: hypothetical protein K0B81_06855 [Candidatus Cloacimonetes bacterium]|nr:hypothetical protein [Candidatus Cloacimonadota bacterium]
MRIVTLITLIILTLVMIFGCSTRKNIIGEDSDLEPNVVEIKAEQGLFEYYYSYENETGNFMRNTKSITGHFRGNESITLLRFTNLPDSGFVLTEDPTLTLKIRNNYNAEGMTLRFGLIRQNWHHFFATWEQAEENIEWELSWDDQSAMEILDGLLGMVTEEDSLVITIPSVKMQDIIEGWIQEEPESYGLAIFSEVSNGRNDQYVEFYSRETTNGPILNFEYYTAETDTIIYTYERMPLQQTFINSKKPVEGYYAGEEIIIGNIVPTRSVIKLNLEEDSFDLPPNIDLKMITVNRADLIVHRKTDEDMYHFTVEPFEFYPYYLLEEFAPSETEKLPIEAENIGNFTTTVTSFFGVDAEYVSLNITPIVQAHISEIKENFGLLITSSLENKDNGFIGFYTPDSVEIEKRPYLRVIYTLPFLPE